MNVVDSSAWLEFFAGSANGRLFRPIILDIDRLLVPTIVVLEVLRNAYRQRGVGGAEEMEAALVRGSVVPLSPALSMLAARLGVEHRLPLADSIVYATAVAHDAEVWTQDRDFEGLAGVHFFPKR